MKTIINLLFTILFLSVQLLAQYPSKPKPMKYVSDFANMLSSTEINNLEEKLSTFSRNNPEKIEMVLVIVNNLSGKDIKEYSIGLAENWNIGRKGKDKGNTAHAEKGKGYRRSPVEHELPPWRTTSTGPSPSVAAVHEQDSFTWIRDRSGNVGRNSKMLSC